jgi:hypothetical protein
MLTTMQSCQLQGESLSLSPCFLRYFLWLEQWGSCSVLCGGGRRTRTLNCVLKTTLRPASMDGCQTVEGQE